MRGYVVEHVRSGVRYAVSEENIDPTHERIVRPLAPGETVLGYRPKPPKDRKPTSTKEK